MLSSELQEALDDPGFIESLTDEEMALFIEEHPEIMDLVLDEGLDVNEAIQYLGELKVPKPKKGVMPKGFKKGNPGNNPFKTQPLHGTSSAGKGGGTRKNPRTSPAKKSDPCSKCVCTGYVCVCKCKSRATGKSYNRSIDMRAYKERKKDYMFHWRRNHGPKHPR